MQIYFNFLTEFNVWEERLVIGDQRLGELSELELNELLEFIEFA